MASSQAATAGPALQQAGCRQRLQPRGGHCRQSAPQGGGHVAARRHGGASGGSSARRWHATSSRRHPAVAAATLEESSGAMVVREGDLVAIHWKCMNEDGEVVEDSRASGEGATTFEVGAGDIVGNQLFEAFDEAVRGLAVGGVTTISAQGGEWQKDLMFTVPREHQEVQRLEGRYKNMGGVKEGLVVELSNGGMAVVVRADEVAVVLDANSMLAGKTLMFELEVVGLDR